jgi:hypothetical protein
MVQTSVQFTPVQVLQAARRAEAEGKMDYALQFYRHLVEQHGGAPEAQEAREGLFRIAEWRWGEARVARTREAGNAPGPAPAQAPQSAPAPGGQRVYNVANNPQPAPSPYAGDHDHDAAGSGPVGLPQIISRQHAQNAVQPVFHARFRIAKFFAHALSGVGWMTMLVGVLAGVAGFAGLVAELSAVAMLGTPFGVMVGAPAVLFGLILIVSGQLAAALFESTNATLELVSIERGRAGA